MRRAAPRQWKWRGAAILTAMLVGAATSTSMAVSGCGPNEVILNDCVDAGASDGGDSGDGGGFNLPPCP